MKIRDRTPNTAHEMWIQITYTRYFPILNSHFITSLIIMHLITIFNALAKSWCIREQYWS